MATVSLEVFCTHCHGMATLYVTNWPEPPDEPMARAAEWSCPYCRELNALEMPGELLAVTSGHEGDFEQVH